MSKDKRSFFERLTGVVRVDNDQEEVLSPAKRHYDEEEIGSWTERETEQEGELTVDVYETPEMVVIKSMIAGVKPEDLDISITRDVVTIHGKREEEKTVSDEDFIARELYWGSFSCLI